MSKQPINQYYNQVHRRKRAGIKNEMAIKQPFDTLLAHMADQKHYVYATEVTIKNENGKNIRPDGILMNELRIHKGYVESKDADDSIDDEINKKLYKDEYPKSNILFQNSIEAVLIQNGEEVQRAQMEDAERLDAILKAFIDYKPACIQKFDEALNKFKEDIPTIVGTLRKLMEEQSQTNETYTKARDAFWEMCQQEINPGVTQEDVREMVIQHILTEGLFRAVFDESDFHHENNIARELGQLTNTFMDRDIRQNQLGELDHYYQTLNTEASKVADHHEKQRFLKVVYENFYKVYNPKGADRLGVVYTPNEIVDFMIRSTDYLLEKHFGRSLHDPNVHILDPATGTGTFITDIIEYIPAQYLPHKYEHEIHANEVAILPYYVASLNIEFTYKQKMGSYAEFPNICFVDTLDNTATLSWDRMDKDQGAQTGMFGGVSSENAERIKKQNQQKISVIIGNPPYNANQANFNDFNKNREYPFIDKRIKETFVKYSTAQKTKAYDMYARFYRWAMDRVDKNGIIAFVTNSSFLDSRTFDGFRKSVQDEFNEVWAIDFKGNSRTNGERGRMEAGNVFGVRVGIAVCFMIKNTKKKGCRIFYHAVEDYWKAHEKLEWIRNLSIENIPFQNINPDKKNNWIHLTNNDWEELIPLCDKQVKLGKSKEAVFELFSLGAVSNRDEWVYDCSKSNLENKIAYFISKYEEKRKQYFNSDDHNLYNYTKDPQAFAQYLGDEIKFTRELITRDFLKNKSIGFDKKKIIKGSFRPFCKFNYYYDSEHRIIHEPYQTPKIFGDFGDLENKIISFSGIGHARNFHNLASVSLVGLDFLEKTQCLPLYRYDKEGVRHDNVTDWGLAQFQSRYSDKKITKEDIFHYTYGVLHHPAYRKKYERNLKREFPRLPFYDAFRQWATWGQALMGLHIGYEEAAPFDLKQTDITIKGDPDRNQKAKLKAKKDEGIMELDEQTSLGGIPPEAWEYKLGHRSALEWVLDQYKEKKPRDKTIAKKFNAYRFADHKEHVIELLKKVTTVSVETVKIIEQMDNAGQAMS